jgi:hypothetical protein
MGWTPYLTHRQFRVWVAWKSLQWNMPSRSDEYLMQVAAECIRPHVKKPDALKREEFFIDFDREHKERQARKNMTPEQVSHEAKMRAIARVGKPRVVDKDGRIIEE